MSISREALFSDACLVLIVACPVGAVCADAVRTGGNDLCRIHMDYIHFPGSVGSVSDLLQMGASRQVFVEKDSQLVRIAMDGCAFARPCRLPAFFLFP